MPCKLKWYLLSGLLLCIFKQLAFLALEWKMMHRKLSRTGLTWKLKGIKTENCIDLFSFLCYDLKYYLMCLFVGSFLLGLASNFVHYHFVFLAFCNSLRHKIMILTGLKFYMYVASFFVVLFIFICISCLELEEYILIHDLRSRMNKFLISIALLSKKRLRDVYHERIRIVCITHE